MTIRPVNTSELESIFLDLPAAVYATLADGNYDLRDMPNSRSAEKALLNGTHPLSSITRIEGFLMFDLKEQEEPSLENCLARIALIHLKDDVTDTKAATTIKLYFGFFDARLQTKTIEPLLRHIEAIAVNALPTDRLGLNQTVEMHGPLNGNFWMGYRFKMDHFDEPAYIGEPINPAHYPALFLDAGYHIADLYSSNFYAAHSQMPPRMQKRLKRFRENGYDIRPPKAAEVKNLLPTLHRLLTELYSSFPTYRAINEEQFFTLFSDLTKIIDRDLVRIAIKDGETVAFLICFPDYGNRLNSSRSLLTKLLAILSKKKTNRAVLLYLGVRPGHLGLGPAMVADLKQSLDRRHLPIVGALIHSGKITADYAASQIVQTNHYALLAKTVSSSGENPDIRVI